MKTILSTIMAVLIGLPAMAGTGKVQKKRNPIADRYVVQFDVTVDSAKAEAKSFADQFGIKVRHVYQHGVKGFSMDATAEQAAAIALDSRVKTVEEDSHVEVLQVAPASPPGWALDRINQRYLPLDHSAALGCNTAPGVNIYILDTGINATSAEFGARLTNGYTVDSGNYSDDWGSDGHGTQVASIAGGATYGVATSANLINVKIVGPAHTGVEHAIAGIDYVIGQHWSSPAVPKVINFSQAYDPSSMLDAKAIDAVSQGITFVAGAGNQGGDPCDGGLAGLAHLGTPNTAVNPTPYSVIAVGGTKLTNSWSRDEKVYGSNHGTCVDIFAPGSGVDALANNGTKDSFGGTSAAAPYVSGAVARHLRLYIGGTIPSPAAIEAELKSFATTDPNVIYARGLSPNLLLYTFYAKCRAY